MGFYIQGDGRVKGKADWILQHYPGTLILPGPVERSFPGVVQVCIVDNGPFDAAGICYDQQEFEAFRDDDPTRPRPKQWLLMTVDDAVDACPSAAKVLRPPPVGV